ncbi:MAG: helix-hairpin-helix domain-containing protein [Flavobacterium sp.]|nr:helix-hairpin-helix domain-containing protein [Flavobacterium sp.]
MTIKSFLKFNKSQRSGIFFLFGIIIVLQILYFFIDFTPTVIDNPEAEKWLSLSSEIENSKQEDPTYKFKVYPYNPNFITDFKGYKLGMATEQIDRLFAFRKLGKFANSPKEFQAVTGISDSLLKAMSPNFKFPEWVNNKSENNYQDYKNSKYQKYPEKEKLVVKDINLATKEDLMKISGIGDAISDRILGYKLNFKSFVSMDQMNEIFGLSPEIIQKLNVNFQVINPPNLNKVDINNASVKELTKFPYFKYILAKNIVIYRSMNGEIKNIAELSEIKDFPVDKIKIIVLYLQF